MYFVDTRSPEDKAIQSTHQDTPCAMAALDLRAEPIDLSIPPIDKDCCHGVQLIDLYTLDLAAG